MVNSRRISRLVPRDLSVRENGWATGSKGLGGKVIEVIIGCGEGQERVGDPSWFDQMAA